MSSLKVRTKDITKESLEDFYFNENMSQDEIGRHFGFFDRQPIMRLFKKYGIVAKSKKETSKIVFENKHKLPTKDELECTLNEMTIAKAAIKYGIGRQAVSKLANEYGISTGYFVNANVKEEIKDAKYEHMTPKELALHFDVEVGVIRQYKKSFTIKEYDIEEIKQKFTFYSYDTRNQGFSKQLQYDDPNLYNSILNLTKNHTLYGTKITEKVYRVFNGYKPDQVEKCKYCGAHLKFYTYELGYGNSDHKICEGCSNSIVGVSLASESLFNVIYEKIKHTLTENDECHYDGLNKELRIDITEEDYKKLPDHAYYLNKNYYRLDFVLNKKVIEFDGVFYHTEPKKELAKDALLNLKGYEIIHIIDTDYYKNKDETIQRCLTFLLP